MERKLPDIIVVEWGVAPTRNHLEVIISLFFGKTSLTEPYVGFLYITLNRLVNDGPNKFYKYLG